MLLGPGDHLGWMEVEAVVVFPIGSAIAVGGRVEGAVDLDPLREKVVGRVVAPCTLLLHHPPHDPFM